MPCGLPWNSDLRHHSTWSNIHQIDLPHSYCLLGHRGLDCMSWIYKLPVQTLPITTKVASLNPRSWQGVLNTALCDKFVSDLRQVDGFLRVLWFPPPVN
jgi:hypothetical protein